MNYLFIHGSHDGTVTVVKDNEIIVHTQIERFNRFKHTTFPSRSLIDCINNLDLRFDEIHITGLTNNHCSPQWLEILQSDVVLDYKSELFVDLQSHHDHHASSNELLNPFDDAHHLVWDLAGDLVFEKDKLMSEQTSIYDFDLNLYYKDWYDSHKENICIGAIYKQTTDGLGLNTRNDFNEGKTMALSSYGKFRQDIYDKIYQKDFVKEAFNDLKLSTDKTDTYSQDFVKTMQIACEVKAKEIVKRIKSDRLVLTGGVAQNILINTELSKDKSIFVNPFCNDQGISLGKAVNTTKGTLEKPNTVYLGFKHNFNTNLFSKNFSLTKVDYKDVAKILLDEPVAVYQGRSEQGQRALGNRSLLMNPAHKDAVLKVNNIKKREWYRPFACSIISEEFTNYFYSNRNTNPSYMNFVYKVKPNKRSKLQSVLSIDDYSRVQSVTSSQNFHYYNLIKTFGIMYGFPVLLNTSLNLPGRPIVETFEDLREMMLSSNLKYSYLPDYNLLITKHVVN